MRCFATLPVTVGALLLAGCGVQVEAGSPATVTAPATTTAASASAASASAAPVTSATQSPPEAAASEAVVPLTDEQVESNEAIYQQTVALYSLWQDSTDATRSDICDLLAAEGVDAVVEPLREGWEGNAGPDDPPFSEQAAGAFYTDACATQP